MRAIHPVAALCISVVLGLSLLILILALPSAIRASRPEDQSGQEGEPVIGLASDALRCLTVGGDLPGEAFGVVHLSWSGWAERARLILRVSGTEAVHTIKVNGKPVASAPIHPYGQPCRNGESFYLDIPPEVLVQGDNLVEITNDGLVGDSWTAYDVRLEVIGHLTIPVKDDSEASGPSGAADAPGVAGISLTIQFTNPYDGSTQQARVVDPGVGQTAVPLVIFVHGRGSSMYEGETTLGEAVITKTWLLASPELHGRWNGYPQPDPPGKYAYASLESQHDIVGTVNYMLENYNVITNQIYLVGYSMGGQIAVVTAAKFPHVFAAAFDIKGPTDMGLWYGEQWEHTWMERECHVNGDPKPPEENPFCYQRRSGVNFASNYIHLPISITHSVSDSLVPIHHSRDLRDAINSYGPDWPTVVFEDTIVGPTCDDDGNYHCFEPDPKAVLDFLDRFTLNNVPTHMDITTDESKLFHWMKLAQTGGDHWTRVEVAYYPISTTVTALISDTEPLTVGFNLGSTPMTDIIEQPGMGLPATTYLIRGGGVYALANYTSGYLTTTLSAMGQYTLTISAVEADIAAKPAVILGGHTATSTITAVFKDHLSNPIPDGTIVQFSTSEGVFPDMSSTYAVAAAGGQATATLTLPPTADLAEVSANVEGVVVSASVDAIYPRVDVQVTPNQTMIRGEQTVTYTYQLTNTGDITLTAVTLVDDNGTPGESDDDLTVCANVTLAAGATTSYSRSVTLTRTTTSTVTATGQDPLGNNIIDNDSATVIVQPDEFPVSIFLPVVIRAG